LKGDDNPKETVETETTGDFGVADSEDDGSRETFDEEYDGMDDNDN